MTIYSVMSESMKVINDAKCTVDTLFMELGDRIHDRIRNGNE